MTVRLRLALVAAACLACAACASDPPTVEGPLSPEFGVAAASLQAQIVPPRPGPSSGSSGARAALAITRYDTDKVIPPVSASTSAVSASTTSSTTSVSH